MKKNHTEALQKIGAIMKSVFSKQKFTSGKLSDGTAVEYSKLEPGADFSVTDEEGELSPAPVGEYELEDGSVIVVSEAGKIAEVKPAAPAEGEGKEEEMAEETPAEGTKPPKAGLDWSQQIEDMKRQLTWQAERIASLVTAMEMFKADTKKVFAAFQEYVEADANSGGGAITNPKQTRFEKYEDVKKQARDRFGKAFAALDARTAKAGK